MRNAHVALLIVVVALSLSLTACHQARRDGNVPTPPPDTDKLWIDAQNMLRLDDYQVFEKAEFRFLALRYWRKEDVKVAGQLAQMYVAWTEQLRFEIDFLRLTLAAYRAMDRRSDWEALSKLIDFRLAKEKEMEEQARQVCNMLVTYHSDDYISHRVMADYYRVMGDREKMTDQVLMLRAQNPESAGLAFVEGASRSQFDKDYMAAIPFYEKALQKDPHFTKALYFKALALHYMGDAARAQATMEDVLKISPQHPGARAYLTATRYLATLSEDVQKRLAAQGPDTEATPVYPKLIHWLASWNKKDAQLSWRLAGAPRAYEIKVATSLVENGDHVLDTRENTLTLKAGAMEGGTEIFKDFALKEKAAYQIIVHISARSPEGGEFATFAIQTAPLPGVP